MLYTWSLYNVVYQLHLNKIKEILQIMGHKLTWLV